MKLTRAQMLGAGGAAVSIVVIIVVLVVSLNRSPTDEKKVSKDTKVSGTIRASSKARRPQNGEVSPTESESSQEPDSSLHTSLTSSTHQPVPSNRSVSDSVQQPLSSNRSASDPAQQRVLTGQTSSAANPLKESKQPEPGKPEAGNPTNFKKVPAVPEQKPAQTQHPTQQPPQPTTSDTSSVPPPPPAPPCPSQPLPKAPGATPPIPSKVSPPKPPPAPPVPNAQPSGSDDVKKNVVGPNSDDAFDSEEESSVSSESSITDDESADSSVSDECFEDELEEFPIFRNLEEFEVFKVELFKKPEAMKEISQTPVKDLAYALNLVDIKFNASDLMKPANHFNQSLETDNEGLIDALTNKTTSTNENDNSLEALLFAQKQQDSISLVKRTMTACMGNPYKLSMKDLLEVLWLEEDKVVLWLQSEQPEVLEFFWECFRAGWVYKYLNKQQGDHHDSMKLRELLFHALTMNPSLEQKKVIKEAMDRISNKYKELHDHLFQNPSTVHIKDLVPTYKKMLVESESVELMQNPPQLEQRIKTMREEALLYFRIVGFLESEAAEVTDQIEKDAVEAVAKAAHLGLTTQQVKALNDLASV